MLDRELLRLVGAFYEAGLDPSMWPPILGRLCETLGGHSACLLYHDPSAPLGRVETSYRLDPEAERLYGEYFGARDPWARELKARNALTSGLVSTGDAVLDQNSLQKTEYYADYARRYGISQNVFSIDIDPASGAGVVVTVLRSDQTGPFEALAVRLLTTLRPHIHRALRMNALLSEVSAAQRLSEAALDKLSVGVLLVNATGRVIFANSAARAICAKKDGLMLDHQTAWAGRLDENVALQRAVGQAIQAGKGQRVDVSAHVRISRPSGRRPLTVCVDPLPALGVQKGASAAIAFVIDPERPHHSRADVLTSTYGLTRAEAVICDRLASGESISDVAEKLAITVETARTHLKRILDKTDTHRQSELVRLLLMTMLH